MKKRILSLLLIAALGFTLLPVQAYAQENTFDISEFPDISMSQTNPLYPEITSVPEASVTQPTAGDDVMANPHFGTMEEVAADMRAHLKARDNTFTVYLRYVPTSYDTSLMTQEIMDIISDTLELAMAHTGQPDEGDYLRLQWGTWNMDWGVGFSGTALNLSLTFTFDYFSNAEQEAEMDLAVEALLQELDLYEKSDYEKIQGIYDYICSHIVYDSKNQSNHSYYLKNTAYAALINGTAVCQGFATLFYRLALELGVDARLITGTSSRQTHSWNIVRLDGLYYNADTMWDSQLVEMGLPYQCFLVSDDNLSNHVRNEDYAAEEFCAAYPMGTENYVPHEPEEDNEVASGWSGDTTWVLTDDGVLTVRGEGNMKDYGYNGGQPWEAYADQITEVVIESGVTAIGSGAFRYLTALETVTLPETGLSKIGEAAFYGCSALKEIYIPDGIYTIWPYTFKNCTALGSVRLPATLTRLHQGAFEGCTALDYMFIPGKTMLIGPWSFKGCSALKTVDMQWVDAAELREGAFKNCTALKNIHLPEGIEVLGDSAFYGIGTKSFTVPETVTFVGAWCFARSAVEEIRFEGDAPQIGEGAFNKITVTACYPGGNDTWTADVMQNYGGIVTWKEQ